MVWIILAIGALLVLAIAYAAVSRVSTELEGTMSPALLEIADAVEVVSEAVPFEVAAAVSHDDVETVITWVLRWFDEIGLSSDFGEELGGYWVEEQDTVVIEEVTAADFAVARAVTERSDLDAVHVTVIVDEFLGYLRDIGAVGGEAT